MATNSSVRPYVALLVLSLLPAFAPGPGPTAVLDAQDRPIRAMVLTDPVRPAADLDQLVLRLVL